MPAASAVIRFGPFEVDLERAELRKHGLRVKLAQQPLHILGVLLEKPGELVSRQDLCEKLWPDVRYLDFDHNLNKAVRKLRDALNDSAEKPRFIETVARRGYRFIAPVSPAAGAIPEISEPAQPPKRVPVWAPILAAVMIGLMVMGMAVLYLRKKPPQQAAVPADFVLTFPATERLGGYWLPSVAVSPDGLWLVYAATRGATSQLFLRAIGQVVPRPIPGTEGATGPFFSPDGQWVGFTANGRLEKVALGGGAPVVLYEHVYPRGASWAADGSIILAPTLYSELVRIPPGGGPARPVTRLQSEKNESSHRWPEVLPGSKAVLFTISSSRTDSYDNALIAVQSFETGQRRILVEGGTSPRYAPTGHLVFARAGALLAAPFDLRRLELTGRPVTVLEGVMQDPGTGAAQFGFSGKGSLFYVRGALNQRTLVWVNREGVAVPLSVPARAYSQPRISPDGKQVAVHVDGANNQVWVHDLERGSSTRLTFDGENSFPIWTPDGHRLVFASTRAKPPGLFSMSSLDSTSGDWLSRDEAMQAPGSWSPDGRTLAFSQADSATGADIWILSSGRQPASFLRTPFDEDHPMFSPDGRWLAYSSNESGRREIYVQPFPGPSGKWQISSEGGDEPVWSHDGRELFYRQNTAMMAVSVSTSRSFSASKPRKLFEGVYWPGYDVEADGRFLMIRSEQLSAPVELHVVLEWFLDLKQRMVSAAQRFPTTE